MRILRVIASMDPKSGGPCQGIRNSIPVQLKNNVENEVVCFDDSRKDFIKAEKHFKIHALGPAKGPYNYCKNLSPWLQDHISRFNIIIIHGLWTHHSFGTYRIWRQYKKRNKNAPGLFVMPHGMLDPYFQKAKSRRFKAVRNWIFWNLIENKVVNGADGLLFTCKEELELARKTFDLYRPKGEFNVGYGIPEPPVRNIKAMWTFLKHCPRLANNSYWLFLSRIHPKKGVDLLIKSYLKLKNKKSNIPDLVIAGPGIETSYGKEIKALAKDQPIYFPGMLKGYAKWSAFHFCDAFILPSHQENFGIAVVEALACEKPVLITDQINIWREIDAGKAGLIAKDNEEGIYNLIKRWDSFSIQQKEDMSTNAYKVYRDNFSVKNAALRMVECISDQERYVSKEVVTGTF
jgi:glycosyltransferase involved in cell wall biosynthesis